MRTDLCKKVIPLLTVCFLVVSILASPAAVLAADTDYTIKSLSLSIRPEYDQPVGWPDANIPAVLIMHQANIVNNTDQPITTFAYPAPVDAPEFFVFAVGRLEAAGKYYPAPNVLSEGKIQIDLREYPIMPGEEYPLVVQYYYNPFTIDGAVKSFQFEYAPEDTIEQVAVSVLIPQAARNAKVTPADYALTGAEVSNVNKDNPIKLDVSYNKPDNVPTNKPLNSSSSGGGSDSKLDGKFYGFLALLAIMAFVFFLVINSSPKGKNQGKQKPSQKRQQASRARTEAEPAKTKSAESSPKAEKAKTAAAVSDEQKALRKQLLSGEIDEETYKRKLKKLSS